MVSRERASTRVTGERRTAAPLGSYDAYGCRVNAIDPDALFDRYAEAGFLYPAKCERLRPFMAQITESWHRALRAGELLHWIATYDSEETDSWASISSWRSTHRGWNTQHLVSIGGPVGSRAVMLAGQAVRIADGVDRSHQNWFRPDNRFPNRLFGTITNTIGEDRAAVHPQLLLSLPIRTAAVLKRELRVSELRSSDDADLHAFAARARGAVYAAAEDLDHEDILLAEVDNLYSLVGLRRYRRIFVAWRGDNPVGAALAYRGPLGFNFSFLENRCDLLLDPDVGGKYRQAVVRSLAAAATAAYVDFPPAEIPLVVAEYDADEAVRAGASPIRRYTQSIWLQEGFSAMYGHMARFYERVEKALERRGAGPAASGV